MSGAAQRMRMCRSKARYTVLATANAEALRIRRADPTARVRAYRCPHCGALHLGNMHPKYAKPGKRLMAEWSIELGERAAACLKGENAPTPRLERVARIAKHALGARRRALAD